MIRRIDHISIAVRDLNRAKAFFLDGLGGRELFSMPMPLENYRWTTIELGTSCFIELVDPLEKDGFLNRFLETRGEGPHHITIQVDDIQETRRTLQARGIPTFGFSESLVGWKEFFIHPRDAFGTLLQFAEFNPLDWINPGYIPPSYREFAPPQEIESKPEKLEIRKVETEEGSQVEIRQGEEVIRIPEAQLEDFIQSLKSNI
ncbi:MAG: VOC family protein [Deltaproteobacteria bacterium]|nr:VOC family protein [Deltaproteobacteria bacterium]